MPISGSTRDLILAYAREGRSQRWIAQETGIARNTVAKVIAEGAEGGSKSGSPTVEVAQKVAQSTSQPKSVSRTRDYKEVAQKVAQFEPPSVMVIAADTVNRDLTISELFDLLQVAKESLHTAKVNCDPTSKEGLRDVNNCVRNVKDILTLMGKWCGLDDTIRSNSAKGKPASELTYEEAIAVLRAGE